MERRKQGSFSTQTKLLAGFTVLALLFAGMLVGSLFFGVAHVPQHYAVTAYQNVTVKADTPAGYTLGSHTTVTVKVHRASDVVHVNPSDPAYWQVMCENVPNTLTNNGKDFIEQQISGTSNVSQCIYIALSETTDTPVLATWLKVPSEITVADLTRHSGTYTSTGTGTWTVIYTFTAENAYTVRVTGLHWKTTSNSDGNMLAAVIFTSPVTLASGDSLQVTWSGTIS